MIEPALPPFPLVRSLSKYVTPTLIRLPITANQVTTGSLLAGLAAAWCVAQGTQAGALAAGALLVVCYVLDNSDGEVARAKNQCSTFGMYYDSFVDWAVHTGFFAALGIGVARGFGNDLWLHLGLIAAAGGTVNYGVGLYLEFRQKAKVAAGAPPPEYRNPEGTRDWALYVFRELTRADFCFIVLVLAAFDLTLLLLPFGAIGSQVYWITQCVRGAREFHV